MRYCPYCGASILDDAAFCMECGATIPVSGVPKEEPKQRAPQTKKKKHKPKPIKRRPDAPPPDPQDEGYDGYYDDVAPLDTDVVRPGLDREMIKKIVLLVAGALLTIALCVVLMTVL